MWTCHQTKFNVAKDVLQKLLSSCRRAPSCPDFVAFSVAEICQASSHICCQTHCLPECRTDGRRPGCSTLSDILLGSVGQLLDLVQTSGAKLKLELSSKKSYMPCPSSKTQRLSQAGAPTPKASIIFLPLSSQPGYLLPAASVGRRTV